MRRKIPIRKRRKQYPSNVPKRLFELFRSLDYSVSKLAEHLEINSGYISRLLIDGIEPNDTTENGQLVRQKLFLSKKKKKIRAFNRTIENPKPPYQIKWNRLPKDERHKVMKEYIQWREKNEQRDRTI